MTRLDLPGRPEPLPQPADPLRRGRRVALARGALVDPDIYRRFWRPIFSGTVVADRDRLSRRPRRRAARRAGSTSASSRSSRRSSGSSSFVLALAGLLAERAARGRGVADDADACSLFGAMPVLLVFVQPDLGTALVYMAALGAMLFVAGTPWRQLSVLGGLVGARARPSLGGAGGRRQLPAAVPEVASHLLRASAEVHRRRALQPRAVDRSCRLRPVPRPRPEECDADAAQLPAGARHRLRLRVVQRAARLRRRVDPARAVSARAMAGTAIVAVARDLYSAVVAGGIVLALSSRSS